MKIQTLEIGNIGTNCYVISDDQGTCAIIDCDGNPQPLFGAVEMVKEKYGCPVYACKKEQALLADPALNCSLYMSGPTSLSADVWVQEGDAVKVGDLEFTVLETPGHTAGSVCYLIGNNIFSGDTLFQGSCGRTDLPTGNWGEIIASLKRLRNLPGDYNVYPGHGPSTTMEIERRMNPYM